MSRRIEVYVLYLAVALAPWVIFLFPKLAAMLPTGKVTLFVLTYLPYAGLLVLSYLAFQLNQTRILFASLVLLATYHILRYAIFLPDVTGRLFFPGMLAFVVPATLALFFLPMEGYLWNLKGLGRVSLALLPLALAAALFYGLPQIRAYLAPVKLLVAGNVFYASYLPFIGFAALVVLSFRRRNHGALLFLEALLFSILPLLLVFHISVQKIFHTEAGNDLLVFAYISITILLLHAMLQMYWRRVYRDTLTDIPNRRALDETLIKLPERYAIGMVDIDHFKSFNDTYGHEQGDDVLRLVARHLQEKSGGRAFRYGGEEFCLLFKGWDLKRARDLADEIRDTLAIQIFRVRKQRSKGTTGTATAKKTRGGKIQITVSIGIAAPTPVRSGAHDVIRYADQALYQAKHKGRNRVEMAN